MSTYRVEQIKLTCRNNLTHTVFILFLSLTSSVCSKAQTTITTPSYSITNYTDENGLPQNSVKGIATDNLGFIWLTTENGIVRFDGHTFYTYDKSNSPIPSNRFHSFQVHIDKSGKKLYTNCKSNTWIKIENGYATIDSGNFKRKLLPLKGDYSEGKRSVLAENIPNRLEGYFSPNIYVATITDKVGEFYVCHPNKIDYYFNSKIKSNISNKTSKLFNYFILDRKLYHFDQNGNIKLFNFDKENSSDKEIIDCHISGDIIQNFNFNRKNIKIFWNNTSEQLFIQLDKYLYSTTLEKPNKIKTRLILQNYNFEEQGINNIYYDTINDRIFLGSYTKGLFVIQKKVFNTVNSGIEQSENVFYGQTIFDKNTVLTPTGQILGINQIDGKVISNTINNIKSTNKNKYSIITDKNGFRWVRSGYNLLKYSNNGQHLISTSTFSGEIEQVYSDNTDSIWVMTKENGLYLIDISKQKSKPQLFIPNPLRQMCMQRNKDTLWMGTLNGLYKIQISTKKVVHIPGTENFSIRSLHHQTPGQLWFTTHGDGFFLLNHGKLIKFPADRDKYLNTAHCIFEDRNGYFWITSNKGLFQIFKQDLLNFSKKPDSSNLYYHYYSKESGFNTNEFNGGCQPCALRLPNDYVSIPSINGLVWFKPENIKAELPSHKLFISEVYAGEKRRLLVDNSISLEHNPEEVKLKVSTLYFGNINNLHLYYALSEKNSSAVKWNYINDKKTITISNLNSGNYTLHIKKINGFKKNNYTYNSIDITVNKAWYETGWFILLAISTLCVLIYLLIKLHSINLINKNKKLELTVKEHTKNLHNTLDALQDSEEELGRRLKVLSLITTSITHDVAAPLGSIILVSSEIENMIQQKKYDMVIKIVHSINDTASQINSLLLNRLDYMKAHIHTSIPEKSELNIHNIVLEKFELFQLIAKKNGNKLFNDIPTNINIKTYSFLIGIILNNIIENAIKFTNQGKIRVHHKIDGENLYIIISDTGNGIPDKIKQWINSDLPSSIKNELSNHKIESNKIEYETNRVGLAITKQLSAMAGLRLLVEVDNGTHVHLLITDYKK